MSRRPNLVIDISSDEEDDDELLKDTSNILRRKSPTAAALVTPKQEEYLTPLGTSTFQIKTADYDTVGQEVKLSLEEKKGTSKVLCIHDAAGKRLDFFMPTEDVRKLLPILSHSKLHCRATRPSLHSLNILFSARANRLLSEFESAPLVKELKSYLKESFTKIRKVTPVKPDSADSTSLVPGHTKQSTALDLSGTAVTPYGARAIAALPQYATSITPHAAQVATSFPQVANASSTFASNIQTNSEGQAYSKEQEEIVKSILDNEQKGFYAIFGLAQTANLSDIKSAYRSIARKVHPDKNKSPGAKRAFQLVGLAYSVLSEPEQRKGYDEELRRQESRKPEATQSSSHFTPPPSPPDFDVYEIFRNFFSEEDVDTMDVDIQEPDWEDQHEALEKMFDEQVESQIKDLPAYEMPPQFDHLKLFDYQIAGIRWMLHQERSQGVPSWFIQKGPWLWQDKITESTFRWPPPPVKGGILADDMGLGKTLQALGLILSNPPKGQNGYPYVPARSRGSDKNRCTLIICPLSVVANWTVQIKRHINQGGRKEILKVGVYHGPNRRQMVPLIQANQYDIVLTSYHTLAADFRRYVDDEDMKKHKPKKSKAIENEVFLFDICLHRIILDEAHIIRNPKTTMFKAVKMLSSTYKLCLTGTPFVNRPQDIQSLLSFLGALPLAKTSVFKQFVVKKIKERKEVGMKVLRAALAHVSLRRRKDFVADSVKLVARTIHVQAIPFDDGPHKDIHDALYEGARCILERMFQLGDDVVLQNYMHFIALILRVRQAACHASLIPPDVAERSRDILKLVRDKGVSEIDVEEAEELLDRLRGAFEGLEKLDECAVCFEGIGEDSARVLRPCKHIFCAPCLNQVTNSCCPLCRAAFTPDDMISKAAAENAAKSKAKASKVKRDGLGQSPKLKMLFDLMERMEPDEKGVIFSQWTCLLDIVQKEMEKLGHTFTRIDGSMNAQERIDAMEKFDTQKCDSMRTPRFVLCSLHACGVGINLERGNVAFMLDPWWNAACETQAANRIHRISSTRPVRIYRLLMADTLEHRMLGLQDAKELLGKGAMERLTREEARKARLTQLRDLFQLPESLEQDWVTY